MEMEACGGTSSQVVAPPGNLGLTETGALLPVEEPEFINTGGIRLATVDSREGQEIRNGVFYRDVRPRAHIQGMIYYYFYTQQIVMQGEIVCEGS